MALAMRVFERLQAIRTRLTEPGALNDVATWETEIRLRLDDDELVNLSAKMHFEGLIAHTLANDFQEGQFAFFQAAAEVFDWTRDRRHLQEFGYAGSMVNAAIDENYMFRSQHELDAAAQRGVFDRMRREAAPTTDHLMRDLVTFEKMCRQFPNLMAMRAPAWKIEQWQQACQALRAAHGDAAFNVGSSAAPAYGRDENSSDFRWLIWVSFFAIISLARVWNGPVAPPDTGAAPAGYAASPHREPAGPIEPPGLPSPPGIKVDYVPGAGAPDGTLVVTLDVWYDLFGKVTYVKIVSPSIDPAFDEVVASAYLGHKFPATGKGGKERYTMVL
jgi:hypothetical protein